MADLLVWTRPWRGPRAAIVSAALPTIAAMQRFDVQVSGAGIVGKTLALSLARLGLSVALRGAPASSARADVLARRRGGPAPQRHREAPSGE